MRCQQSFRFISQIYSISYSCIMDGEQNLKLSCFRTIYELSSGTSEIMQHRANGAFTL